MNHLHAVMLSAAAYCIDLRERGGSVMRVGTEAERLTSAPKRPRKACVKGTGGQGGTGRRRAKRGGR